MPNYGVTCKLCGTQGEIQLKLKETDDYDKKPDNCECGGAFERTIDRAPAAIMGVGDPKASDANYGKRVAQVHQKCRDHFEKNEKDDLHHKHGAQFNDALRSGEVERVKKKHGISTAFDGAGRKKY